MKYLFITLLTLSSTFAFDHEHKLFNQVLSEHYKIENGQGQVHYTNIQKSPNKLNEYLKQLENVTPKEFNQFSSKQKLSFWINAYNAYTIKLILNHYPLKSIKDIGNFFSGPWDKKFFSLLGKKRSLDEIEHKIIRKEFDEPRIHFVVNCASIGCPNLYPEAMNAEKLEVQLIKASQSFISEQNKNEYKGNKLYLSKIFKWYGDDFDNKYQNFRSFIAPLMTKDQKLQKEITSGKIQIKWLDYDWKLNEWK